MKCDYGCGNDGLFEQRNGKWCCEKYPQLCPSVRGKNSEGVVKAHKEGRIPTTQLDGTRNWAKGRTAVTDTRIKHNGTPKRGTIRNWLHSLGVEYKCNICGLDIWRGESIPLEIDHINGDNKDNHPENLRWLCPNCHSLTPTWRGRNNTGKVKVTNEELLNALRTSNSIYDALKSVGLAAKGGNYERCHRLLERFHS